VEMVRAGLSAAWLGIVLLSSVVAVSTAQQRFQFCGGPGLIHAVIRVCSRSLPDELVPPPGERPTTTTGNGRVLIPLISSHCDLRSTSLSSAAMNCSRAANCKATRFAVAATNHSELQFR